jgi:hypothetical protein
MQGFLLRGIAGASGDGSLFKMISRAAIAFSQPWSGNPSIRVTFFDVAAIGAIAFVLVAFLVFLIVVILDFYRGPKCKEPQLPFRKHLR